MSLNNPAFLGARSLLLLLLLEALGRSVAEVSLY